MAEQYRTLVKEAILSETTFRKAVFTGQISTHSMPWIKATVRPVLLKEGRVLQIALYDQQRSITKNYDNRTVELELDRVLGYPFKHIYVEASNGSLQVQVTKRGKVLVHRSNRAVIENDADLRHDRQKKVLLPAARPDAFLQEIGIMSADGRIRADKQRKFRQVNEFLKILNEASAPLRRDAASVVAVDLGCGNAYLTFALYHYFNALVGVPAQVVGVDADAKTVESHSSKLQHLGWHGLSFQVDQIEDFVPSKLPNVVVALHACDTATDEALAQAIRWKSEVILSVPCCHHQLQVQLRQRQARVPLVPELRNGVLSERLGDVLTDAFRAQILRVMGYHVDVIQFVTTEHTAKNLMIRAIRSAKSQASQALQEYNALKEAWQVTPYLEELLGGAFAE